MLDPFENLVPPTGGLKKLSARLAEPRSRAPWLPALVLTMAAVMLAVGLRPQQASTLHPDHLTMAQLGWGEEPPTVSLSSHPNRVTVVGSVVYVELLRGPLVEHHSGKGGHGE